jgi:leucyl-tRNA synthetase
VGEEGVLVSYEEAEKLPESDLTWRWVRMSKSKGNVVTPDEAVAEYGADALRLWELFVAPFEADVEWTNEGMVGTSRFLSRVFRLAAEFEQFYTSDPSYPTDKKPVTDLTPLVRDVRRKTHQAIKKVTEDVEAFAFNTAVAALMSFVGRLEDACTEATRAQSETGPVADWAEHARAWRLSGYLVAGPDFVAAMKDALDSLLLLLAPMAPHTADEIWEALGHNGFTYDQEWPKPDPDLAKDDTVTVAVQVNGKLRDTIEMPADATQEALEAAAKASEKAKPHYEGKTVRRIVVVAGKLVNIVAN